MHCTNIGGYIKGDRIKHISLKFFYIHIIENPRSLCFLALDHVGCMQSSPRHLLI